MTETVRWELEVSKETDRNVRRYLTDKARKGADLSRVVERVVSREIVREMLAASRARNADLSEEEVESLVEDARRAVRSEKLRGKEFDAG